MYRGKHRNNQRPHRGKRILLLLSAVTLLIALMCAGTFALLKEQTGPVTNSFSAAPVTYTLTVDANTGTFPETTVTQWEETVYTQSHTFTVTLSEGDLPTKENHTLLGWATDKAATTVEYTDLTDQAITLTADAPQKTLYAIWEEIPTKVFAVFDSSDGSLNFYNRTPFTLTDTQTEFTGFDTETYSANTQVPWYGLEIKSITVVDDGITPNSTAYWFCNNKYVLTSINNVGKLDTSNVTSMKEMFRNCNQLTSLDVSGLETSNVSDMSGMFRNCNQLTNLTFGNFDTSKVTTMRSMFLSCQKLPALDLSSFDTPRLTDMYQMFNSCNALTTVYVSEKWTTESVSTYGQMFPSGLIGGAGTTGANENLSYARIDGGSTAPGYFTYYKYAVVLEPNYGYGHGFDPNYENNDAVFNLLLSGDGEFTLPANEPSHPNAKVFLGWATTADATTPEYEAGATFTSGGTAPHCDVLYAVWKWGDFETGDSRAILDDAYKAGVRNFVITGGEWKETLGKNESITVRIKDGTFSMAQFYSAVDLEMIIDGGRFVKDTSMWITGINGTSIVINGGYFEANSVDFASASGSLVIYGGTFEDAPEPGVSKSYASHLAEGYTVVANDDGTWTVVRNANAAFVNEEKIPACSCETKCIELSSVCEVCKTDFTLCKGTEAPAGEELTCSCETKCSELTEACEICKTDITSCEGAEIPSSEEPPCSCETKCTEGAVKSDCPVCGTDIIKCIGKEQETQNELESPVITVTPNITGLDAEKKWEENGDLTITLTPQEGHTLPNAVTVKIDDVEKTAEDGVTYIEGTIAVPAGLLAQSCTVTVEVSGDSCEAGHDPSEDDGNCTTPVLCSVCHAEVTVAKEHAFDNDCDSACNSAGCTHTREITHTPNADDGDSATPITCTICNAVVVEAVAPTPVSSEFPATNATPTPESIPEPSDSAVTSSEPALLPAGNGEEEEEEE